MGQVWLRVCTQTVSEACPGCPGPGTGLQYHQQRMQDMMLEVEEARRENQRLSRSAHTLRLSMQDGILEAPVPAPDGNYRPPQEQGMQQELLQLKRHLWDLQRENGQLKANPASPGNVGGGPAGGNVPVGRAVSFSAYSSLQQQVNQLEAQQRMRNAQGNAPSSGSHYMNAQGNVPDRGSHYMNAQGNVPDRGSHYMNAQAQGNVPDRGSHYMNAQGNVPDRGSHYMNAQGNVPSNGSHYMNAQQQRYQNPGPGSYGFASDRMSSSTPGVYTNGGSITPSTTDGSGYGSSAAYSGSSEEVRRRVKAMQGENDQLKKKVRLLAAS